MIDDDIQFDPDFDDIDQVWQDFWEGIFDDLPEEADEADLTAFFDGMIDCYGLTDQEAIDMLAKHIIIRSSNINKPKGYLH